MDTKSQNNSGPHSKAFALLLLSFILLATGLSTSFETTSNKSNEEISYFKQNEDINEEVLRFAKNLQRYYIYFSNFSPELAEAKLNEISNYISSNNSSYNKSSSFSRSFKDYSLGNSYYNKAHSINSNTAPELLYNIDLSKLSIEDILSYETRLADTLENYNAVHEYLANCQHFDYYIYNTQRGYTVATNSENFFKEEIYDAINIDDDMFDVTFNGEYISSSFKNNKLSCTITIPVNNQSNFINNAIEYTKNYYKINSVVSSIYTPVILYTIGLLLLLVVRIFRKEWLKVTIKKYMDKYSKLPAIIKLFSFCFSISFILMSFGNLCNTLTIYLARHRYVMTILYILLILVMLLSILSAIKYVFLLFKRTYSFKNEPEILLIASTFQDMKFVFTTGYPLWVFIYIVVTAATLAPLLIIIILLINMPMIGLMSLFIYSFYFSFNTLLLKFITSYVRLNFYIEQMSKGEIKEIPESKSIFGEPINNLRNIGTGLQTVVENMLKNERLKTELITNVSHDLKTPLTSIINYISLLKALHLENEKATEYIDIVDSKAKRLNILIQDLFEASKLSSGQLELEIMESDIISLINQTVGELSYKIEQSGIEFIITTPTPPLLMKIDGQRMWRVFDNLVNNIIKYSPANSRAYINLEDLSDRVIITLKNVSNYPLAFDADELFERFKRGDKSRTTEGSGLGLSIAKSIVELHGGTMDIVIDGDLFKTIITLYK